MEFKEYQRLSNATDQVPGSEGTALVVPLLGIAGEAGSLLVEYKKLLRDGPAHRLFREQFAEDIGDILWYLSNLASKFNLELDTIAQSNLQKTRARWLPQSSRMPPTERSGPLLDSGYPPDEQLPRSFVAEISEHIEDGNRARVTLTIDGVQVGDKLRDNSYDDDGYRFHDVFHLAHAAKLGWSPTLRRLLKRKRRSVPQVDEVEDGGRAGAIDEAIVAFVFDYARKHRFLQDVDAVDYSLLRTVQSLASQLEVSARSPLEWEQAILAGYKVWRGVREQGRGRIRVDLASRTIELI